MISIQTTVQAATSAFSLSQRLAAEPWAGVNDLKATGLLERQANALASATSTLRLVDPSQAWLVSPVASDGSDAVNDAKRKRDGVDDAHDEMFMRATAGAAKFHRALQVHAIRFHIRLLSSERSGSRMAWSLCVCVCVCVSVIFLTQPQSCALR